jgi:thymidylate synthase (FAD)
MLEVKLLDHGYLRLVEAWGSDEAIIEAARQSTQKGFLGWEPVCTECSSAVRGAGVSGNDPPMGICGAELPGGGLCKSITYKPGDEKLLRFMWENSHSTPFEFAGAVIEVQAPIFVFREWHRHRTQSYSEMSARYSPLPDVNYIPTLDRLLINSCGSNRQAGTVKGAEELTEDTAAEFIVDLEQLYAGADSMYRYYLKAGVPKEIARIVLPVGRYSRMRASANLRNWLGFLTLRQAPNAQWEIRQYADALTTMLTEKFPRTMALFKETP